MWKLKVLGTLLEVQSNFVSLAVFGEMCNTDLDTGEFLRAVIQ